MHTKMMVARSSIRHLLYAALAIVSALGMAGSPLQAQGGDTLRNAGVGDSVSAVQARRRDCRLAMQAAERWLGRTPQQEAASTSHGRPMAPPYDELLLGTLVMCGREAGPLTADLLRANRTLTDTAQLRQVFGYAATFRDASVFAATVSIATDLEASSAARVAALRNLHGLATGQVWWMSDEFEPTGEMEGSFPVAKCGRDRTYVGARAFFTEGTPLPADYVTAIGSLARRLAADRGAPLAVRAAASCTAK